MKSHRETSFSGEAPALLAIDHPACIAHRSFCCPCLHYHSYQSNQGISVLAVAVVADDVVVCIFCSHFLLLFSAS